jgi:hypothetical protein
MSDSRKTSSPLAGETVPLVRAPHFRLAASLTVVAALVAAGGLGLTVWFLPHGGGYAVPRPLEPAMP